GGLFETVEREGEPRTESAGCRAHALSPNAKRGRWRLPDRLPRGTSPLLVQQQLLPPKRFDRACSCEADARPEYGNEHHRHDRGRCDPPPTARDGDWLFARRCEVGVEEELRAPQEAAGSTQ